MSDLSQDELTVLLIAAKGEPMMPIGRWKAPTESLVKLGYMKPHPNRFDPSGYFNVYITPEGQAAVEKAEDAPFREMLQVNTAIQHETAKIRAHAEQIAVQLVDLANASHKVTGDTPVTALENWSRTILTRALELLK